MNSVIVDGQNQLNGGSNIFVLKVNGDGSAYVQTDTVFTTNQLVGLTPASAPEKLLIHPNPAQTKVQLSWPSTAPKQIAVYNAIGTLVLRQELNSNQTIDLQDWPSGLYLLRIEGATYPIVKY
jgi:hypothetical protein